MHSLAERSETVWLLPRDSANEIVYLWPLQENLCSSEYTCIRSSILVRHSEVVVYKCLAGACFMYVFAARCYASAAYAVMLCLIIRPSVRPSHS